MIAVDSSTWIAYFRGEDGPDVEACDEALAAGQVVVPPVVLVEILSDPALDRGVERSFRSLPAIELRPGYWERAAATRSKLLGKRLRARLADTLISQSCIDDGTPLITRDGDFRHFARHAGLAVVGLASG